MRTQLKSDIIEIECLVMSCTRMGSSLRKTWKRVRKAAESRPTVRAKRPVQQRKGDKPIQFVTDGADSYPMSCTPLSVMGMGGSSPVA